MDRVWLPPAAGGPDVIPDQVGRGGLAKPPRLLLGRRDVVDAGPERRIGAPVEKEPVGIEIAARGREVEGRSHHRSPFDMVPVGDARAHALGWVRA
jgi:hypothetical protein